MGGTVSPRRRRLAIERISEVAYRAALDCAKTSSVQYIGVAFNADKDTFVDILSEVIEGNKPQQQDGRAISVSPVRRCGGL